MTVKDVSKTIVDCLQSILSQNYENFEIVIINDFSTDDTKKLIHEFDDNRIRYFENEKWLGLSPSRNKGINKAIGEYVFFTDGDCIVSKNWIEIGLRYLRTSNCIGVEGRIYYVSKDYKPTFSDHVTENRYGGHFMTGNMAYKRVSLEKVGGFDERLTYLEDRDIALRIMQHGKICFSPEMIVHHPKVIITPKKLIESASYVKNRVYQYRKFQRKECMLWRIVYPLSLIKLLFPPLIFSSFFFKRFKNPADFRLFPFTYLYFLFQRLHLWKECAREKILLI